MTRAATRRDGDEAGLVRRAAIDRRAAGRAEMEGDAPRSSRQLPGSSQPSPLLALAPSRHASRPSVFHRRSPRPHRSVCIGRAHD